MDVGAVLLALEGQPQSPALTAEGLFVDGLLPVANRLLVQHAIDALAAAGARRVVVACTGPSAPVVREAVEDPERGGVEVRTLEVPPGAGPLAAVLAARALLPSGPVVLHDGDSLMLDSLAPPLERFRRERLDALVVSVPDTAETAQGAVVLRPRARTAGVQVVGPKAMLAAEQLEARRGAAATLDDLPEAVRRAGGRVEDVPSATAWRFTGDPRSLLDLTTMVLERLPAAPPPDLGPDVRAQGRIDVDPTARVRSSKLRGPVLLGPGARIQDSYVGPYTCIGAGAVLEGAEIEHSVVLPGAEINHVGVRIEDSLIGAGARVHRTFAMPTALRLYLGAGGRVALS